MDQTSTQKSARPVYCISLSSSSAPFFIFRSHEPSLSNKAFSFCCSCYKRRKLQVALKCNLCLTNSTCPKNNSMVMQYDNIVKFRNKLSCITTTTKRRIWSAILIRYSSYNQPHSRMYNLHQKLKNCKSGKVVVKVIIFTRNAAFPQRGLCREPCHHLLSWQSLSCFVQAGLQSKVKVLYQLY